MKVSRELIARYDTPGPRYTSYPTAPSWSNDFGEADYRRHLIRAGSSAERLSMYVHVPFCERLCLYCGCSVVITRQRDRMHDYVSRVLQEARLAHDALGSARPVVQHHWGGGTPTFLSPTELERLFTGLVALFPLDENAEVSIEIDPAVTTIEQLDVLRTCGFNRISMGVQDFDAKVQETVHRIQSVEATRLLVDHARALGFLSVNLDLIYGLPHQTPESFGHSVDQVLKLRPERIACYGYAHVPWLKKHQRALPEDALPRGHDKIELYLTAYRKFREAGYEAIGMDHFALPQDAMMRALADGTLHRNFMGYAVHPAEDMLSFGASSISEINAAFAQNHKGLKDWSEAIDTGRLPIDRGLTRSADDTARRRIILDLMCRFRLDYDAHGGAAAFRKRYADALVQLEPLANDGVVELDDNGIRVTELGQLFVRNAAMPFDAYLAKQRAQGGPMFSRTV
ncbi:MAG: oxygen-independent coproporphyrinogen III oxidase [Planctomycetes bacterium]|nr:oxygen-independent coproporphyrinogen III oxidase [Planctomycetota bacterium]